MAEIQGFEDFQVFRIILYSKYYSVILLWSCSLELARKVFFFVRKGLFSSTPYKSSKYCPISQLFLGLGG